MSEVKVSPLAEKADSFAKKYAVTHSLTNLQYADLSWVILNAINATHPDLLARIEELEGLLRDGVDTSLIYDDNSAAIQDWRVRARATLSKEGGVK